MTERPDVPPGTRRREALILAAANEVQAERGGPTLDHVADLFNGDATFVGTHPALDPYRHHRAGTTWWPCAVPLPRARTSGRDGRALLFAYPHAGHPALDPVLSLLGRIGRDGFASGTDGPAAMNPHVHVIDADPRSPGRRSRPAPAAPQHPTGPDVPIPAIARRRPRRATAAELRASDLGDMLGTIVATCRQLAGAPRT